MEIHLQGEINEVQYVANLGNDVKLRTPGEVTHEIHNKKKLVTCFENQKYICLEDILNSDSISAEQIIGCIDSVMSKKLPFVEIDNERCIIEITEKDTEIYDGFMGLIDDSELYPGIKIHTIEFKKLFNFMEE